jgi:zinc protease
VKRIALNAWVCTLVYSLFGSLLFLLSPNADANELAQLGQDVLTVAPAAVKQTTEAPSLAAVAERVITVEGITEYRLANGMKILLLPDESKETVTVDMTYLAGARHEMVDEAGTAKLLQRLLFKGTTKNPSIGKELSLRGARFAGAAWQNRTHFSILFQARDETLDWVLQMEADRMVNTVIAQKDIDAEIVAMLNDDENSEKKQNITLSSEIQKIQKAWSSYGNPNSDDGIASAPLKTNTKVKIESLQTFYRTYYRPDNAVLLVAGKFDEVKTLRWVANYFGAIPKPARALPKPQTRLDFKTADGERSAASITASYRTPSALDPDAEALRFSFFILLRLRELSIESKRSAYGGIEMFAAENGLQMFVVSAMSSTTKSSQQTEADLKEIDGQVSDRLQSSEEDKKRAVEKYRAREAERAIVQAQAELQKLVENFRPTAEEMARARQHFISEAERTLDNHEKLGARLSEYIALGDWRLFFHSRERAGTMAAEQVSAAAAKFYRSDNRVSALVRTKDLGQRLDAPPLLTAADVLKNFKGKKTRLVAAVALDPDALDVDKRTTKLQIGGLMISLLAKKTDDAAVAFNFRLHNGDEKSLFGKAAIAEMTGRVLDRGTSKFQFGPVDEKSRLRMRGDISAGSANFQTTRPYVADAIALAAHMLREPTFPEVGGKTVLEKMLEEINLQKRSPAQVAMNALQRHFNIFPPGDIRHVSSFDEQEEAIKTIKASDLRAFHKQFYGAAKGEIAVVGNFDEAEVITALREAFGDWKTGAPYTRLAMPYKDIAPVNRTIDVPGAENAFFSARLNINMQDTDADYAALLIADQIFASAPGFESRLTSRIRVRDGSSRAVRSELSVGSTDRGGAWSVYAYADAQNITQIEKSLMEELADANRNGFTASEVASAKSAVLQQRRGQRLRDNTLANGSISPAGLAGQLIENSYLGRTFEWSRQFEEKIKALELEQVNAAFRKYIVLNKISIVKAGDFKNTKSPASATASSK